ncbi:oxidoreductase [Bhargavaea cecembensis]|uniref:Oxidoreductase n=1 Tax=Bhargavaea cecembensis TaxID=394098 RepID=A0A163F7P3_9BACL|nr:aldo/keto reductase [Bhargavaea cecembensis]KZE38106.1 oxidoreductase [Bhargavaea cecembensis]
MKTRKLGNAGPDISEIGLGCMSLPDDARQAERIVDAAMDAGINYFDTADLYGKGRNEELLGKALRGRRADMILATKVGNRWTEGKDGWEWDPSPGHIRKSVHDSLKRLGTDYIDVYQLHGGTADDDLEAVIGVFEDLKREGLIRQYGISSIRPNVFLPFLKNSSAVSNMMQYSLLDRRPEEWLGDIRSTGASVVARGPIAKGLLTAEAEKRAEAMDGYLSYSSIELRKLINEFGRRPGPLYSAALAFVLENRTVASAITGASSEEQLKETLSAYEHMPDSETIRAYAALTAEEHYEKHRD